MHCWGFANISSYDTPAVIRLPGFRKRIKKTNY
nr:MAG TPA: hypothetical protein [Caudoviricetes sp.]